MKLPTNKAWWQFWIPRYVDVSEETAKSAVWPSKIDKLNNPSVIRGRVVKATVRKEFDPFEKRTRGRVVKSMPRQLKKIKEGQDAVPKVPSED